MTTAVCHACGEFKFGAFVPCSACGNTPATEEEQVVSLAMTDHFLSQADLRQLQDRVRQGLPIDIDERSREALLQQVRQFRRMFGMDRPKKPWWQFW
ncbi:MAG: hypothetical protein KDC02_19525 [Flavobacteriales bacterium]|nr:hypothetical protein [Flavobacteriales bacterium]